MAFTLADCSLVHANGQRALDDVYLSATQGERLAIIGPSGAGKTTLLRLLGASLRPSTGTASLLEASPWALAPAALRQLRARIGTVHQQPPIPPRLRVVNAVLAGRLGRWPTWRALGSLLYPVDIAGAEAALDRVQMADRVFSRCDRLSGGQLQRVGIARVLYQAPDLMLADEPVSSLDPTLAGQALSALVDSAQASGATLVASLHAVDLALQWFPRIVGLRKGRMVFDLPASEVSKELLQVLYYNSEGGRLPLQDAATPDPVRLTAGGLARPDCL